MSEAVMALQRPHSDSYRRGRNLKNPFETIHIEGFRRLQDVRLNLNSLNVVIGANGSRKTSLLDVFSLLAASAAGKLNDTFSDIGGIESNLTMIRYLKPAEILTININEQGGTEFTRADELDLDRWLEKYTLDEKAKVIP